MKRVFAVIGLGVLSGWLVGGLMLNDNSARMGNRQEGNQIIKKVNDLSKKGEIIYDKLKKNNNLKPPHFVDVKQNQIKGNVDPELVESYRRNRNDVVSSRQFNAFINHANLDKEKIQLIRNLSQKYNKDLGLLLDRLSQDVQSQIGEQIPSVAEMEAYLEILSEQRAVTKQFESIVGPEAVTVAEVTNYDFSAQLNYALRNRLFRFLKDGKSSNQ